MKFVIKFLVIIVFCLFLVWIAVARPFSYIIGPHYSATTSADATSSSSALENHVKFLSVDCYPRSYENIQNLNRAAQYIKSEFTLTASQVDVQKYETGGNEFRNIIGIYGPDTDEVIIVGAHYDAFVEFPGADDNASGVAGLIELGHLLSKTSLNTRILLVAYTLEEPPFFRTDKMGSAIHAQSLVDNNINVRLMISLEMIGYFTNEKNSQDYPSPILRLFYPNKGNFIAVVDQLMANHAYGIKNTINQFTDLPAYSINAPSFIPGSDFSDHMNYWKHGYPAVMVTDTAFYRNVEYHTQNDTHDRLDYPKMAKVVYGVSQYLQSIDE